MHKLFTGPIDMHFAVVYCSYEIDGVPGHFSVAPDGTKLGDYGHFTDSKKFCCKGNLFADTELPSSKADITPRQHTLSLTESAWHWMGGFHRQLYEPLLLSLPSNDDLNSLLASLSARLTNRYLVTRVIQCLPDPQEPGSNTTTTLYTVAKPFVWHRNERAGFVSEEQSGNELRGETKGDQVEG
ncbi:hypothetical protein SCLCIDRAFT_33691 [Scleroderma citrinum Foug A]|uniref:Uncharacterized protein n=1 Tax=Scleroderma citrinum Foug A TaxID=1036808 RepID=A0A0C3D506_9AGAM|nr:hypothetical protein SCLCIDRAFT_33691 [Scleroderma citrinum Foug A]